MKDEKIIEEFMKDRVLFMEGKFEEKSCQTLKKKLLQVYKQDQKTDIIIYIDSYGGDVCSYLEIYSIIESFKCNIHTIVTGKAMSAGAYLLLAGTKGYRYAYKYSQIMLHELAYESSYKKLHDQKIELDYSKKIQNILNSITKKSTKIKNVSKFLEHDKFLSVKEAKKLGIIDHII